METQTGRTSSGTELREDCYFKSIYTEMQEVLCWSPQREVPVLKHMQCKSKGVIRKKGRWEEQTFMVGSPVYINFCLS